jgi:hypothetical protein
MHRRIQDFFGELFWRKGSLRTPGATFHERGPMDGKNHRTLVAALTRQSFAAQAI